MNKQNYPTNKDIVVPDRNLCYYESMVVVYNSTKDDTIMYLVLKRKIKCAISDYDA